MRDLLVSLAILGILPLCFRRPFIGLLVFTLLAYMRVQDLTWGFARFVRWSYYVSIVMFLGFLVARGPKRIFVPDIRSWIMLGLVALVGMSLLVQKKEIDWARDFTRYIEYCKIVTIALFTTAVVRNREQLRMLILAIALSFGFFGVKSGVAGVLSGGSAKIIQGPGGMISDNNDFAMALCMAVPMLLQLGLSERRLVLRRALLLCVPLTMITVVMTHSRGAFLSMGCMTLVLIWRSRNRVAGFSLAFLIGLAGLLAAPAEYKERISTISEYEEDASAMGRIAAWRVAGRMIADNPFLGVGFDKFQYNYRDYDIIGPEGVAFGSARRVAHNSYLQIWAECGTPAFLLYLTLILLTFLDIWGVRRMAVQRYNASWILSYATMFEATLASFVIGSVFLNRAHFDLFYHLVAIVMMFGLITRQAMRDETAYPLRTFGRGQLSAVRRPGFGRRPAPQGFAGAGGAGAARSF